MCCHSGHLHQLQTAVAVVEALQADLKAHQRQLMSTATDILAGCDDEVWPVAAPTACALLCGIGEDIC